MHRVAVLLSTHNGSRFILDQMNSIIDQDYHPLAFFWRDDGSTDETVAIVEKEFQRTPLETNRLGMTQSYARLLRRAWEAQCTYFAYCDQDDVWKPHKITRAINALRKVIGPALYCARQTLIDDNFKPIGVSPPFRLPIGFPAALTQNVATGCTIVINREAAELVLQTLDEQPYYDWWSYLIVSAAGGQIIADDEQVVYYRPHPENRLGVPKSIMRRALAMIWRGPYAFMSVFRDHVKSLQDHEHLLTTEALLDLAMIGTAVETGLAAKWRVLQLPGFNRQSRRENTIFRLWFLIG